MDAEFKKLLAGSAWAATGDRTDPTSPVTRSTGWPASYSLTDAPTRTLINQILRELYGAALEVRKGVPDYDAEVSYPQGSVCQVNGRLYFARQANGPPTPVNPVTLNNTAWLEMGGIGEAPTAPSAISSGNIFIDGSLANRIAVYWAEPDNGNSPILSVDLRYSKDSAFPAASTTTITNYQAGDPIAIAGRDSDLYYVSLRFNNLVTDDGNATPVWGASRQVLSSPLAPDAVTGLQATGGIGSGLVNLAWGAPYLRGLSVTDYLIQWKSGSQSYSTTERFTTSTSTSKQITGLANDTAHTFRVIARSNRSTNSPASNEPSATPSKVPDVPDAPTILFFGLDYGSFEVSIGQLPNDNGAVITAWEWQIKRSGDSWDTASAVTSSYSTTTANNFSGLTSGQVYTVRCRAYNGAGDTDGNYRTGGAGYGPFSQQLTVSLPAISAPGAPSVTASMDWNGNIHYGLASKEVSDDGSTITGYAVQYRLSTSQGAWSGTSPISQPTGTITGLDRTKSYTLRMYAVNSFGNGTPSQQITVNPNPSTPRPIEIDLSFRSGNQWIIYLTSFESDGGSDITGFDLSESHEDGNNWTSWDNDHASGSDPFFFQDNSTQYARRYRMRAKNSQGAGPWSNTVMLLRRT